MRRYAGGVFVRETISRTRFPVGAAAPLPISYGGRKFTIHTNSSNGHCTPATIFHYRQSGSRVWATYQGGPVHLGSLLAVADQSEGST